MDIRTFCKMADEIANGHGAWPNDLIERYRLLGLPETGNFTSKAILDELHTRIRSAFVAGERRLAQQCGELLGELIHDHILEGPRQRRLRICPLRHCSRVTGSAFLSADLDITPEVRDD